MIIRTTGVFDVAAATADALEDGGKRMSPTCEDTRKSARKTAGTGVRTEKKLRTPSWRE
jgi:hypothetical protein